MEMEMELWERRRNNINEMETGQSMLRGKINNNCVMTRGRKDDDVTGIQNVSY